MSRPSTRLSIAAAALAILIVGPGLAHDPDFTQQFDRDSCTFSTVGSNPFFPLWPGYRIVLEGEEENDEQELEEIGARITVLDETEVVDGVLTRVVEEYETEDGELVEVSRNYFAHCRETGDVWYFGEDVDDYEDGEIVGHGGAWRAGTNGATAGVVMPGSPMIGARFFTEFAPGVAEDRTEIIALGGDLTVPGGTFSGVLETEDGSALNPSEADPKFYAPGVGIIKDEELELVSITLPSCVPDATTHCLNNGRFKVQVEWDDGTNEGEGNAILGSDDSGEFWFFSPNNTELIVKVLDACSNPFNHYWVFAGGLTDVEVTIVVTDTETNQMREYENPLKTPFAPIQDTTAFATCP